MRLLRDKVLRAMIFSHRIAGNACARGRERIEAVHVVEHVTEIQCVRGSEVMINTQPELISIVTTSSRGEKSVCPYIRLRKEAQQAHGKRALRQRVGRIGCRHLVERIRLLEKDVEELMVKIAADSVYELLACARIAQLPKIALPLHK